MTVRRLTYHGEPVLHTPCEPVSEIDASVRELIADLADTLYATTGVGLAAPQLGVNKRLFVFDAQRAAGRRSYKVLINPRLTACAGSLVSERESCLSAPGLHLDVPRFATVQVEGLDERGRALSLNASGFAALVIQHEMDHLDGKVVTDRLATERRPEFEDVLANIVRQHTSRWYVHNLAAIQRRLDPVARRPAGVLLSRYASGHEIRVDKSGNLVDLTIRVPGTPPRKASPVGLIDLLTPLDLLETHRQAMMLSLLWAPEPARICVVGLGAGRLPAIFHQHFGSTTVDAIDADPEMLEIARRFFGLEADSRLKMAAADGRAFLEQAADATYDVILIDLHPAATDAVRLATREFYQLCHSRLRPGGVVVSSLPSAAPDAAQKAATFAASFTTVFECRTDDYGVMFGSDTAPSPEAIDRAETYYFPRNFRLRGLMASLTAVTSPAGNADILIDANHPAAAPPSEPTDFALSAAGRNDPCPCGSGKKFKKCHGR